MLPDNLCLEKSSVSVSPKDVSFKRIDSFLLVSIIWLPVLRSSFCTSLGFLDDVITGRDDLRR